ncbi:hypothetical protein SUGI_0607550 [Cryptomeria japonica]|nr:hypothetical protein SUGI_0607550 [Cryptomeria japonica]
MPEVEILTCGGCVDHTSPVSTHRKVCISVTIVSLCMGFQCGSLSSIPIYKLYDPVDEPHDPVNEPVPAMGIEAGAFISFRDRTAAVDPVESVEGEVEEEEKEEVESVGPG